MSSSAEVEQCLAKVEQAVGTRTAPALRPFELDDFGGDEPVTASDPDSASDATAELRIEFGRTRLAADDAERLETGGVVALEQPASAPVDLLCDGQLIGRGELLVMDEQICVRVTELLPEASLR